MKPTSNWLEMHDRFRPTATALVDVHARRSFSYRALYAQSLLWAGRLHTAGVAPGQRVAVLCQSRWEVFALLFACAEIGAVLVPLNWRLSAAEWSAQLGIVDPAVVLEGDGLSVAKGTYLQLSIEEGPGDTPFQGPGAALEDPWMILFTSGSTGRPKGAVLSHGQLHWNALNTVLACDLAATDSTLTFTPLFHTGGLNCLSTPLLHRGGAVVLTRGLDVDQALRLVEDHGITLLMGVPTIFQMLADHPRFAETDFSAVRAALVGGAPLSLSLLERYLDREIPLHQGFGMTEVGPNCFSMPLWALREKAGSCGLPIHHVAARVVRPDGTLCAVDEAGELQLRGPVVCQGYWGDAQATAAAFDEGGWFRTGDVLSVDADGFFTVRGRLKEMFISGGENVYPAEVEAAISTCPEVAHVAVIGVPDARWGEVGRAFVEPVAGAVLAPEGLEAHLEGRLARYKRPRHWRIQAELPRTASGKIDKVKLRGAP